MTHPACSLDCCRQHAGHLRQVAADIKRCCQSLAAVLRDNAPVAPALHELARLEQAFCDLQQAVGASAAVAAVAHAASTAAAADVAAEQMLDRQAGSTAGGDAAEAAAMASIADQQGAPADASSAQDSLALHLSLSMLFTCCTRVRSRGAVLDATPAGWVMACTPGGVARLSPSPPSLSPPLLRQVRSMYLLLPQVVAKDQAGVGDAVAAHFATARAWDAALHARVRPPSLSPRQQCMQLCWLMA